MSLVTAIPALEAASLADAPCQENDPCIQDVIQEKHHSSHSTENAIVYLGFITGLLLETCDLGIGLATSTIVMQNFWQQLAFSVLWSFMITAVACIMMLCIQCIVLHDKGMNNKKEFQATFLLGCASGMACAIAWKQAVQQGMFWAMVANFVASGVVVVLIIMMRTKVTSGKEEKVQGNDETTNEGLVIV